MAVMPGTIEDGVAVETDTNIGVPGLWHIRPTDVDRISRMLPQAWRVREIWDDEARANPGLWFTSHYLHPQNLLFDVLNGRGLVAFIRTIVGWRTQVFAAAWSREAKGRDDLFRTACEIAMRTNDLLVIDSFVHIDNRLSQRATIRAGFRNRGIIKAAQCYNGLPKDVYWNEIDRAGLGIVED